MEHNHDDVDHEREPSAAELAALDDEEPLIAAELELLDVQLRLLGGRGPVDALMFGLFTEDGGRSRSDGAWRYGSRQQTPEHATGVQVSVSTPVPAPLAAVA